MDETPKPRRFTILDVMILIAALAAWCAIMRPIFEAFRPPPPSSPPNGEDPVVWAALQPRYHVNYLPLVVFGLWHGLIVVTSAWLFMRIPQPRLPLRELVRDPRIWAYIVTLAISTMPYWIVLSSLSNQMSLLFAYGLICPVIIVLSWGLSFLTGHHLDEPRWLARFALVLEIG